MAKPRYQNVSSSRAVERAQRRAEIRRGYSTERYNQVRNAVTVSVHGTKPPTVVPGATGKMADDLRRASLPAYSKVSPREHFHGVIAALAKSTMPVEDFRGLTYHVAPEREEGNRRALGKFEPEHHGHYVSEKGSYLNREPWPVEITRQATVDIYPTISGPESHIAGNPNAARTLVHETGHHVMDTPDLIHEDSPHGWDPPLYKATFGTAYKNTTAAGTGEGRAENYADIHGPKEVRSTYDRRDELGQLDSQEFSESYQLERLRYDFGGVSRPQIDPLARTPRTTKQSRRRRKP